MQPWPAAPRWQWRGPARSGELWELRGAEFADDMVQEISAIMIHTCTTSSIGDGLVWTVPIDTMHRIRNGSDMLAE